MFYQNRLRLICAVLAPAVLALGPADARPSQPSFPDFFLLGPWSHPHTTRKPSHRKSRAAMQREVQQELYRELHRTWPLAMEPQLAAQVPEPAPPLPPKRPADLAVSAPAEKHARASQLDAKIRTAALAPDREFNKRIQGELQRVLPSPEAVPEALACAERLAVIARYRPVPRRTANTPCTAVDLVQLDRVLMPDGRIVTLTPAPTLQCGMAEALGEWIRGEVGPAAAELGAPLVAITDNDSYDCRPRNNVKGAKLSEHGKGNAIDLTAVKLGNGRVLNLTDKRVAKPFRERMRAAACSRFSTVLGPGDPYHAEHIHLDLAERTNGYKICQWDVLEPGRAVAEVPLPPHRPATITQNEQKPRSRRF